MDRDTIKTVPAPGGLDQGRRRIVSGPAARAANTCRTIPA
jgi:hypothetical protein